MTVGVAPPNVDADGSVYDVAEISQVRFGGIHPLNGIVQLRSFYFSY